MIKSKDMSAHFSYIALFFICSGFVFFSNISVFSQTRLISEKKISVHFQNSDLRKALVQISERAHIDIIFADKLVKGIKVSGEFKDTPIENILTVLLKNKSITFTNRNNYQIVLVPKNSREDRYSTLTGVIIDKETGKPLPYANVYLANTMIGASSDSQGRYTIYNVRTGKYNLIASYIGYSTKNNLITVSETSSKNYSFYLAPVSNRLSEIEVVSENYKTRMAYLKKFEKYFFGNTRNAIHARLLNPEVLQFRLDDNSGEFDIRTEGTLLVENKALGYLVRIYLEEFTIKNDIIRMKMYPRFEELQAMNGQEAFAWEENRKKAYAGSFRHFVNSMLKNELDQEGFRVYSLQSFSNDISQWFKQRINPGKLFSRSGKENTFDVSFEEFLEVVYTKEKEDINYGEYDWQNVKPLTHKKVSFQTSWIKLNDKFLKINTDGNPVNYFPVVSYGYWAWERAAEMLPVDYTPYDKISQIKSQNKDAFTEGDELRKDGIWAKALTIWENGKRVLELEGKSDPRLGIAYVEAVTENQSIVNFEKATEMYYWGFSGNNLHDHIEILTQEAERILPLLPDEKALEWEKLIREKNLILGKKIREFWIKKDPAPTTTENERLIEHFERTSFAKTNFKKNRNSVYKSDDRGIVYVRYGEPDRKDSGTLGANSTEIQRWLQEIPGDFINKDGVPIDVSPFDFLEWTPNYDIWMYDTLDEGDPVIYVFGSSEGIAYKLVDSFEELIPSRVFSRSNEILIERKIDKSNTNLEAFSMGSLVQIAFYQQLSTVDETFARRYRDLESLWTSSINQGIPPNPNVVRGDRDRFIITDKNDPAKLYAPKETSMYDKSVSKINIIHTAMRTLDVDNNAKLNILIMSIPSMGADRYLDALLKGEALEQDFFTKHSLITNDENWNKLETFEDIPTWGFDNTSVFTLAHRDSALQYVISAETFDIDTEEEDMEEPLRERMQFSDNVRIGKKILPKITPLSMDKNAIELSDLIAGVKTPENVDFRNYAYPVIPVNQITRGDTLYVYLEAYHLTFGSDDKANISVNYRIAKDDNPGFLKKLFTREKNQESVAQQLLFESTEQTSKNLITFDISDLKSGNYLFNVEVTDIHSGQTKSRTGKIKVIE